MTYVMLSSRQLEMRGLGAGMSVALLISMKNIKCSKRQILSGVIMVGLFLSLNAVTQPVWADSTTGPHGGQVIQSKGNDYEVVNDVSHHKIYVYAPGRSANDLPSSLVVKVKREDSVLKKFHLSLLPYVDPAMPNYSTNLPSDIYISGGVTYEIDF